MKKFNATFLKQEITSNSPEAHNLNAKSNFGKKLNQQILYSPWEAFYLMEKKKLQILDFKNSPMQKDILLKKLLKIDKNFQVKYTVFKDLREKGYIVKTALKFGAEFRIYEKGSNVKQTHSKWICYTTKENNSLKWQDFAAKNRVAHSSKKNLLIAIVDEENEISYYEIKWIKP